MTWPLYRYEFLQLEASRMPIDRLETAIESLAGDETDEAVRTRAALVEALELARKRESERNVA